MAMHNQFLLYGMHCKLNIIVVAQLELIFGFIMHGSAISRNGPYIGGHLAFYFKLNFKQVYNVL